jgi:hypothetical protein
MRTTVEADQKSEEQLILLHDDESAPDKPRRGKRPSPGPPPSGDAESCGASHDGAQAAGQGMAQLVAVRPPRGNDIGVYLLQEFGHGIHVFVQLVELCRNLIDLCGDLAQIGNFSFGHGRDATPGATATGILTVSHVSDPDPRTMGGARRRGRLGAFISILEHA